MDRGGVGKEQGGPFSFLVTDDRRARNEIARIISTNGNNVEIYLWR